MARFPFSRAWARGFDAGALGALRRRLQGDGRRRFHQLTNERCADGKHRKGGTARESVGRSSSGSAAGARGGEGPSARGRDGGASSSSSARSETPRRSLVSRGLAAYERLNATHGTATKVGTSVVILLFGDVSAQRIQHFAERSKKDTDTGTSVRGVNSNKTRGVSGVDGVAEDGRSPDDDRNDVFRLDARRVAAFASFGAIYTGWFQMHWFKTLQVLFPAPSAAALAVSGRRLSFFRKDVLGPLLVNQFVAVPCLYYPFYFAWTGFVRGATAQESLDAAREKYKPHLLAQNWAFWLPAQGVQFALVPSAYHILYVSAMGLAWNTILSLTTLDAAGKAKTDDKEMSRTKKKARGKMVVARK